MTKNILRTVIAAVIGIVVAFGLLTVFWIAGNAISPSVENLDTGETFVPLAPTLALIVGWFVGTFAGSWLAMRVSVGTGAGWVVAGSVIGAALYRAVTPLDEWWILVLAVLVPVAAAWLAQRATRIISE
ncbi:hypothetical protein ATE67_05490 [Sphingopyxis sp. H050]|jgi:hypothetical protein|uniref:hypothetical protein n=1 Tax=Sphingopyxis sp. H050 TaxID=1759072 RepID=UPI000737AC3A|nr:hypothetical protein [Sphingopyxis sp. H050]KTE22080.1 hypothetical protein ATE67_05490 [Sphingopyxis sp. H050]